MEPVPLWISFLTYRHKNDRTLATKNNPSANLVSSRALCGKQMPIIDLDGPHEYVASSTQGHGHLYLDHEISDGRWVVLMIGLWVGGVIETGNFMWSLRRGANFVRPEGVSKNARKDD